MPKEEQQKGQDSYKDYKAGIFNQFHVYSRSPSGVLY